MQRQISLTVMHDTKLTGLTLKLGVSRSEVIRKAIDLLLETEQRKDKELAE